MRAVLMASLIAMPALLLPGSSAGTTQIIALLALLAAALTFVEYTGDYPSIVEFRDAPPYNRLRFAALFLTVLLLTLICRGETHPTAASDALNAVGMRVGGLLDFPYSPVRLMVLGANADMTAAQIDRMRTFAGLAYLVSISVTACFILLVRLLNWPVRRGAFNFWVNLPLFDPTAGGDILYRLKRDAHVNIALGFLLSFLIPAGLQIASAAIDPVSLGDAQTLIWTMSAWAFLPASLIMRGVALMRIAALIEEKRRRAYAQANLQAA
ncbi:Arginine/ornithine antiporter ArcD [Salipiger profundus]|uniref:Arginine/ornithine antiporter ArcD n=2 Tax=Roseobacteraceae TaxID=2854170 RepID=A0A1U7D1M7_9RHOB|nr:Arginine/ornithine antiporter ArcD [Salipiger profundus]